MKKIGILTLHRANNYGAVLQNFALLKAIENIEHSEHSTETIDYIIPKIDKQYAPKLFLINKNIFRMLKDNCRNWSNRKNELVQYDKYTDFRDRYLKISSNSFDKYTIANSNYDLYIVGSDQIWNRKIIGADSEEIFSLQFTYKKKASYAASAGSINNLIELKSLKDFDYITVREQDLYDYLNKNGLQAMVVCDPTLLVPKEEWLSLISDVFIDHSNYVYLYYVGSGRDEAAKIANDISSNLGNKVYYSQKVDRKSRKYGINKFSDGPLDFLKEIANSDYVVVSSFHGTVFSILFEKDFIALLHKETGSRVRSLLTKLGLEDRIVDNYDDYKTRNFNPIDYDRVRPILEQWRQESQEELKKICEL